MATLVPFDYHSLSDMADRNEYIADGHGKSEEEKYEKNRNKYIVDGHGASNRCAGHNCPADFDLATQEMIKARALYKHYVSHTRGTNEKKTDVELTQLVLSYTEDERPTDDEMMQDAYNLIMNTDLKDFVCFYGIHKNTDNYHVHISVGAYSKDGTKKLGMGKKKLYRYRAELDRIVAARNLSIVEPSKNMRWYEPEHAKWVDENRDKLTIVPLDEIEPPKTKGQGKKRSENQKFKDAKEEERRKEKEAQKQRERIQKGLYYRNQTYIYQPRREPIPVLIIKLALVMTGKYEPYPPYRPNYTDRKSRPEGNTIYFGKIDYAAQRQIDNMAYAREHGINSVAGLYDEKQRIGNRMNNLKKAIYQTDKRLQELDDLRTAYNRYLRADAAGWNDDEAERKLVSYGVIDWDGMQEVYDILKLTTERKNTLTRQLDDEKKEYRKVMKAIGSNEKMMREILIGQYNRQVYRSMPETTKTAEPERKISLTDQIAGAQNRPVKNEKYKPQYREYERE